MFEKVNPKHPDKVADRIAGAIVDLAYKEKENPKVAVEVLIGHGKCLIINETDTPIKHDYIVDIVHRIAETDNIEIDYKEVAQDIHLSNNQKESIKCGDNGIFLGMPLTDEEKELTNLAQILYNAYSADGKYILNKADDQLIICQSNANSNELFVSYIISLKNKYNIKINPLGYWTGGINVDSGATNRKIGSDMGRSATGGGLHGKDLSKTDVSVNIYAFLKAQNTNQPVQLFCAIGDRMVDGKPYSEIVEIARNYIKSIGGFEKFAEYGLIR